MVSIREIQVVGQTQMNELEAALGAIQEGAPVFRARANARFGDKASGRMEFYLPKRWQALQPDRRQIDGWSPGDALCLATGHVVDAIDVDTKNGASVVEEIDRLCELGVTIVGVVRTPSGGAHLYVKTTGIRSSANTKTGVDYRGGDADGFGRGFLYLPGTARPKYAGLSYAWEQAIDFDLAKSVDVDGERIRLCAYLRERGIEPKVATADQAPNTSQKSGTQSASSDVPKSQALRALLNNIAPRDRSGHFYQLVSEAKLCGYTEQDTSLLLQEWCSAVGKYVDRVGQEVARCWDKVDIEAKRHSPVASSHGSATEEQEGEGWLRSIPLGRRMADEYFRNRYIFVSGIGWHWWDGTRWSRVDENQVISSAATWAQSFLEWLIGQRVDRREISFALRYREVGYVRTLVEAAKTHDEILVRADAMDRAAGILNCANGTVDLSSGELLPHDPAQLLTKCTGVNFRAEAFHDDWMRVLGALPDAQTVSWLQRLVGAAATGEEDRSTPIVLHQGAGANGKTSFVGAINAALGDYSDQVPDKILAGRSDHHDTLWMTLRGVRLAYIEELPDGHVLPVTRIKKLAETPKITARLMGQDFVTFTTTHSLFITTNHAPAVRESDHGTWRRLALVPYPHTFSGLAGDPGLRKRIKQREQQEAVLAWIVQGAVRWYKSGRVLGEFPDSVQEATDSWRNEGDEVGAFLDEYIEFTGQAGDSIETSVLLTQFNRQLPSSAQTWSATRFGKTLRSHHKVRSMACGVDQGSSKRERMALRGVVWKKVAVTAARENDGSRSTSTSVTIEETHRTNRDCQKCGASHASRAVAAICVELGGVRAATPSPP